MVSEAGSGLLALWVSFGFGSCLASLMLLYNIGALVGFFRNRGEDKPSALSLAAWGLGAVSLFLGPCAWLGALTAIILANVERRRIFQDKSTFASAAPCRHASVNGGMALLIMVVLAGGGLFTWLAG